MKLSATGFRMGSQIGALLATLIVGLVLPAAARAESCSGHYLRTHLPVAGAKLHLDLLQSTGALPASASSPTDPMGEPPARRPAPCSGAFCSGNPASIPSSIPLVSTLIGEQWAIAALSDLLADSGSSAYPAGDSKLHPVQHPRSIFHPPPPFLAS